MLFSFYPKANDNLLSDLEKELHNKLELRRRSRRGITNNIISDEKKLIKIFFNALYFSYFSIPQEEVSVPLRSKYYSGTKIGYKNVKKIVDTLISEKLITIKYGSEYSGKVSRIKPSSKLAKKFDKIGFRWRYYKPTKDDNIIIRSEDKKSNITLPNNKQIKEQQNKLHKYNQLLSKHCIALDLDDIQLKKIEVEIKQQQKRYLSIEPTYSLNFSRVHLRRIYSKGKTNLGGRFYGGWWQSLPSIYRPHITIDDYKTVEVDYSTMSLRLLYAKEGKKVPLSRDMYDLGLKGSSEYLKTARKLIKVFINAILNDSKGNFRLNAADYKKLKLTHKELKVLVNKHHQPIKHHFGTGVGLELMYLDSILAERLMEWFTYNNVILLPIHDSFIIRAGYAFSLQEQMKIEFKRLVAADIKVKSDVMKQREHFQEENSKLEGQSGSVIPMQDTYDLIFNKPSGIYERYYEYWYQYFYH